jgi:hypothetical protein
LILFLRPPETARAHIIRLSPEMLPAQIPKASETGVNP